MTLTLDNGYGTTYKFEVVDKIPFGYIVWNIGDNMVPGYLPVCMTKPGTYEIRPETLKAIALPASELAFLRKVAGRGITSKKSALRHKSETAKKAYEIFDRISE